MTPTVTETGTLWWAISASENQPQTTEFADATCPTKEEIQKYAARPNVEEANMTEDQKNNAEKTKDDYAGTETGPADGETWIDFQQRLYKEHLADNWYGALNIYNTGSTGTINASWLFSETSYQICGYAENVYGQTSVGNVAYFSTL